MSNTGNSTEVLRWYKQGKFNRFTLLPFIAGRPLRLDFTNGRNYNGIGIPEFKLYVSGPIFIDGIYIDFVSPNIPGFIAYDLHSAEIALPYNSRLGLLKDLGFVTADEPYLPLPKELREALCDVEQNIYDLRNARYHDKIVVGRQRNQLMRRCLQARAALLYNYKTYPSYQNFGSLKITGSELSLTLLQKAYIYYQKIYKSHIMLVGSRDAREDKFFVSFT